MSEVEPEVKVFFKRIIYSLTAGFIWLLVNATIGVRFGFAFFDNSPSVGNYLFYAWVLASLGVLVYLLMRKWDRL
jgi:membrane protein DedA with SNARE-associated domain